MSNIGSNPTPAKTWVMPEPSPNPPVSIDSNLAPREPDVVDDRVSWVCDRIRQLAADADVGDVSVHKRPDGAIVAVLRTQ